MKMKFLWLFLCCVLVTTMVAWSCKGTTPSEEEEEEELEEGWVRDVWGNLVEEPQYGGTVNLVAGANPTNWDPWMSGGGGNDYNLGSLYDTLLGGDWAADRSKMSYLAKYIPLEYTTGFAAESWENPDPLTYIIHLRQGMKFHNRPPVNGREVIADDFKYSVDRMMGLGEFAEVGPSPYVGLTAWQAVESIEVTDKYTAIIHMKEASPLFPDYWGGELTVRLMPREVVDMYGDDYSYEHAVGSGPWMVGDVAFDSYFSFVKNPDYWGVDELHPTNQIPYADGLKVMIISDQSTQLAAFRTGQFDIMWVGNFDDAMNLQDSNPELKWAAVPQSCQVINLNVAKEPYDKIDVRRAMQMAINLPELNQAFYGGTADTYPMMADKTAFPAYFTPLEEMPADVREAFTWTPNNVTKAKQLLTDAGYPNGFTQEMPMSAGSDLADTVIAYWEEIGITTNIKLLEYSAYSALVYSGQQDMAWFYSCGTWYPTEVLTFWYGGQTAIPWNFANANDPVFNDYLDRIRQEPDLAERASLYKEAFAYGTSQFFYVAMPNTVGYRFWQPWIKSYRGEIRLVVQAEGLTYARVWVDQDLK
jgi:peptide/nickel transport system substrate-binding protein